MYGRHGVLDGQIIKLRAIVTDDDGTFVDTAALPVLYIYAEDIDVDTIEAELAASTFTSATAGPLVATKITTGFYEYSYMVPAGSAEGTWHDVWIGNISTTDSSTILEFEVINGGDIEAQVLGENLIITVELDETVASITGDTLTEDTALSFITSLTPYYASPDLVRMEVGPWLDFIPDATLAMMIHWSSKEADFICCGPKTNANRLSFSRSKFVLYDAALRALYLPGGYAYQPGGVLGTSKRLGDLSITNGNGAIVARTASGIDTNTLGHLKAKRSEWERVVNAGGSITPGQSFGLQGAVKGKYDPYRRPAGRQWADPSEMAYEQPGVNAKTPGLKGKFYWNPPALGAE